jgi:hypothetical protein
MTIRSKLPNAQDAIINPEKLFSYLLSPTHPIGRYKAKFFAHLGYSMNNWGILEQDLRSQHLGANVEAAYATRYGMKYEIRANLRGPNGQRADVVSVWIVRQGEDFPRFVTGIPGERP